MSYTKKIKSNDSRLARHINHDERSKAFAFDTANLVIKNVTHERYIPILDQGQVGRCTGNAGIGAISTAPFENKDNPVYSRDEYGATKLYGDAQVIDGNKPYPLSDTGSSGLSIAKALKNNGLISGYQHTFTLNDALKALSVYPFICGISWYEGFYTPDSDGRVHITGKLVGGHEIEAYRIDADNGHIWFHNSWGSTWGVNGDFYITWSDFATLLANYGDVTVLFPNTITPPAPVSTMPTITLTRNSDDGKETKGSMSGAFSCDTLERPYLNNASSISCIPKGTYICKWSFMPSHLTYHYQLQDVPNRSGIYIHSGNYFFDSEGCIILGKGFSDINSDKEVDVINSKITLKSFETTMNKQDFILIIK